MRVLRSEGITCPCRPCRPCHPCRRPCRRRPGFVLRRFGDHGFGGQHQRRDRRGVLQRGAGHLGRVQDAHFDHVAVGVVGGVEAVVALAVQHGVDHHARLRHRRCATISRSGASMALQHQLDAGVLVGVVALDRRRQPAWRAAAPRRRRHDAFFHGSAGGVQRVFDAGLLFLHFDFGGGTDLDHRNAAGQLGHALLQLLAVVVARSLPRSARGSA